MIVNSFQLWRLQKSDISVFVIWKPETFSQQSLAKEASSTIPVTRRLKDVPDMVLHYSRDKVAGSDSIYFKAACSARSLEVLIQFEGQGGRAGTSHTPNGAVPSEKNFSLHLVVCMGWAVNCCTNLTLLSFDLHRTGVHALLFCCKSLNVETIADYAARAGGFNGTKNWVEVRLLFRCGVFAGDVMHAYEVPTKQVHIS